MTIDQPPKASAGGTDGGLPVRWALIGVCALGSGMLANLAQQPMYVVVLVALTVASILHAIVSRGQGS